MLRERWELIGAAAAVVALLGLGGAFIAQELDHSARAARQSATALSNPGPADASPAATATSPSPPPPSPTASKTPSSTSAPGSTAALTSGTSTAGRAAGPAPAVAYPVATAGAAAYSTKFLASDMTFTNGATEQFSQSSTGAATLHAFWAASSTGYPALRGCLQSTSQPACNPGALPYDSTGHVHWPISAGSYLLRLAPFSSTQLIGISLAWAGAHTGSISGIAIPKACSSYSSGCGLRFEFTSTGAGACTVSTSSSLHLRVQQKDTSNTPIFDGTVPASFSVPSAATWTGQLFSATGPVTAVSMAISWP